MDGADTTSNAVRCPANDMAGFHKFVFRDPPPNFHINPAPSS